MKKHKVNILRFGGGLEAFSELICIEIDRPAEADSVRFDVSAHRFYGPQENPIRFSKGITPQGVQMCELRIPYTDFSFCVAFYGKEADFYLSPTFGILSHKAKIHEVIKHIVCLDPSFVEKLVELVSKRGEAKGREDLQARFCDLMGVQR